MKKALLWILPTCCLLWSLGCKKDDAPGMSGRFLRFYGTTGTDFGNAVVARAGGGYAIAGGQFREGFAQDGALLLTDSNGILVGNAMQYGGTGEDVFEDMVTLEDGGFLMAGYTSTGNFGLKDAWLVRTDAAGTVLWSNNFGGAGNDAFYGLKVLSDGGVALAGYTESPSLGASAVAPQFYLVRTDASGSAQWEHAYGGASEDRAYGLDIAADGTWVVAGIGYDDSLDYEAVVMHITANGDSNWTYTGISERHDEAKSALVLRDGNFAWLGFSYSAEKGYDIILQILSPAGQEIADGRWTIGGTDNDRCLGKHFYEDEAGNFVFAGFTQSKGKGANDIYLVVTQPNNLVKLDKTYGGTNDDIGASVMAVAGGGFVVTGYSKSFNFSDNHDIVLLRVDADGNLDAP